MSEHRRGKEFVQAMRYLAEEAYPQAEKLRVVCDNLSMHTQAAFYENFSPEIFRRLARKIELVYTPVHGPQQVEVRPDRSDRTPVIEAA